MARNKAKASETANPTDRDYVANWRLDAIDGEALEAGEIIMLDPEVAQPFLEIGVLSEVEAAPAADAGNEGDTE